MTSHGNPMSDSLCTNIHCICDIIHTSALAGMNRKGHTDISCFLEQIHELCHGIRSLCPSQVCSADTGSKKFSCSPDHPPVFFLADMTHGTGDYSVLNSEVLFSSLQPFDQCFHCLFAAHGFCFRKKWCKADLCIAYMFSAHAFQYIIAGLFQTFFIFKTLAWHIKLFQIFCKACTVIRYAQFFFFYRSSQPFFDKFLTERSIQVTMQFHLRQS